MKLRLNAAEMFVTCFCTLHLVLYRLAGRHFPGFISDLRTSWNWCWLRQILFIL